MSKVYKVVYAAFVKAENEADALIFTGINQQKTGSIIKDVIEIKEVNLEEELKNAQKQIIQS